MECEDRVEIFKRQGRARRAVPSAPRIATAALDFTFEPKYSAGSGSWGWTRLFETEKQLFARPLTLAVSHPMGGNRKFAAPNLCRIAQDSRIGSKYESAVITSHERVI